MHLRYWFRLCCQRSVTVTRFSKLSEREWSSVTYATSAERRELIDGLRTLANYLEKCPTSPIPRSAEVMLVPRVKANGTGGVDYIAVRIAPATVEERSAHGTYTVPRNFGPVTYKVVLLPPRTDGSVNR